ncbi:MAG TPA: lactonase family protein [Deinococcales bacterium]|nr:lactonase family protein [Deinococcales bacterium]
MNGSARFLVGSYTGEGSLGVLEGSLDLASGALSLTGRVLETENPSYLALAPDGQTAYAVNEVEAGTVTAFRLGVHGGEFTVLGTASSGGADPCHLSLDPSGRFLLVANYSGGSVAVLPVLPGGAPGEPVCVVQHEGTGPHCERQNAPHPHGIWQDPGGRFVHVPDLGTDRVHTYRFDRETGALSPAGVNATPLQPGAGPRHLAYHPSLPVAYLANELTRAVTVLDYDPLTGALTPRAALSTLPAAFTGENTVAAVRVAADGRNVYLSNRGHDSVAVLAADAAGNLELVQVAASGGRTPRDITLSPDGRWLLAAHQDSGGVTALPVGADGTLGQVAPRLGVVQPVCVLFV